jgi:MFS family permease
MGLGAGVPGALSLIANVHRTQGTRAPSAGGAIAGVAIAMGPIVGGWLLEHYSWTAIFIAMAPVAAVAAVTVALAVPASKDPDAAAVDIPGLVLSSATMALLVFTIIEAPAYGWTAGRSVAGFAVSAILLAAFIVRAAPRTRCSTCGCSATCGSVRPAARSRCPSSPCSGSSS